MKLIRLIIFFLIAFFYLAKADYTFAVYDPMSVPNNKYGIHITDENDLESAAALVNSSGGDWGYITFVIREDDRIINKWQAAFGQIAKYRLIPIVRLATKINSDYWDKPKLDEAKNWSFFLDSLPWPIKNRYVVLYNEPNHAKEWGNSINAKEYADIVETYAKGLKAVSSDFYLLPAGFDASSPDQLPSTMDIRRYLQEMYDYKPQIFDNFDGWTSHSYPNPGFRGVIEDEGRGSLRSFVWELNFLKNLGVNKNYPVFITETGWPHNGADSNNSFFTVDKISGLFLKASEDVWSDARIVAVTPFILNYQSQPFLDFSWQKRNSNFFYDQYDTYRSINKVKGIPVMNPKSPLLANVDSGQTLGLTSKNTGFDFSIVKIYKSAKNFLLFPVVFLLQDSIIKGFKL